MPLGHDAEEIGVYVGQATIWNDMVRRRFIHALYNNQNKTPFWMEEDYHEHSHDADRCSTRDIDPRGL